MYSPEFDAYPVGQAMNKNLTLKMGNCNYRRYVPELLDPGRRSAWSTRPPFITQEEKWPLPAIGGLPVTFRPLPDGEGWVKTVLDVS